MPIYFKLFPKRPKRREHFQTDFRGQHYLETKTRLLPPQKNHWKKTTEQYP